MTHGSIVGQVWRGDARQARLAMWLATAVVVHLDEALAVLAAAAGRHVDIIPV